MGGMFGGKIIIKRKRKDDILDKLQKTGSSELCTQGPGLTLQHQSCTFTHHSQFLIMICNGNKTIAVCWFFL